MKNSASNVPVCQMDLIERLSSITEQLEDIVSMTQGQQIKEPSLALKDLSNAVKVKMGKQVPMTLFSVFKLLAAKNLLRGKMQFTSYCVGKETGLTFKVKSFQDIVGEFKRLGLGTLELESMNEKFVVARLSSSLTCLGIRHSRHAICYLEGGLLAGAFEKLLKRKIDFIEESCCATGNDRCVFRAWLEKDIKTHREGPATIQERTAEVFSQENVKLLTSLAAHAIAAIENSLIFEKTRRQTMIDGLTQIYNHRYFQQSLRVEISRALRHRTPIALVMMDIDNFKRYNDRLGHIRGDDVLKRVAFLLMSNIREIDIVARYGGDEFALILPQTDFEGTKTVIERIKERACVLFSKSEFKKRGAALGLCMGVVASSGKKMVKPVHFLHKADMALLRAKKKGKNRIEFVTRYQ